MPQLLKAFSAAALVFFLSTCWCVADERPKQPNIIVFMVDDMGWQDTSVPFAAKPTPQNKKFHTPNMQRLADSGMKFTQAYGCTVCSPSRISLMTGLNAARHRVTNWTLHKNVPPDKKHPTLTFPKWNVNGLSATPGVERTVHARPLPEFLHEAGYRTIHVGKAHFGAIGTPGADPKNLGFDVNIAGHAAGGPGSYLGTKNFGNKAPGEVTPPWGVPGLDEYHGKDIFLTEALTIEANKAIDRAVADKKPFYLYMAHYAVHVPFAPDNRLFQKYLDAGLDRIEAMYAALVEGMDKSLGDILDNLARHKIADDTIVLFMSDNGGLSAHARGGKPHAHNAPLNSGKGSAYEGGIRVPMIVRWPGVTNPGSTCDSPVIVEDFFPTILQMAGIDDPRQIGGVIDGISFVPLLKGLPPTIPDRALYWHYPNNWGPIGPGIGPSSTIREGDWKLIYYHADGHYELFNLKSDLGEQHNLADSQPEVRDHLAHKLGAYLRSVQAQMPTRNGYPVAYPGDDRPRVLIIGDSISIGYTVPVTQLLKDVARVERIPTNGGPTTRGLKHLDQWLGDGHWDVIHFNWGLHDLKYVDDAGKNTTVEKGKPQVPLAEYEQNLTTLITRLKKTGATLIFATTTPVPKGAASRVAGDEVKYNKVATRVARAQGVAIDDLNAFARAHVPNLPHNVHYSRDGYARLGKQVAEQIRAALKASKRSGQ